MAEEARCECGRLKREASYRVQHIRDVRHVYFLCVCGKEWTETERTFVTLEDPVSSDEVIELHERLAKDDFSLKDLLG